MTDALAAAKARVREQLRTSIGLDGGCKVFNAADVEMLCDALDASAWRGIESAPKDGTEFLAAYARQGFVKQLVRFNRVWSHWESKGVVVPGFEANATHYMPLPPPPAKDDTNG